MAKELSRPQVNSFGQHELDKAEKQFEAFEQNMKDVTSNAPAPNLKRMDLSRKKDESLQVEISQNQINNCKDIYLKPTKSIGSKEKFNERFRDSWNYDRQTVGFIAENKEVIGETIDVWTKPYPGVPAEEWIVPVNVPVFGPRYLAEQIKRKYYNRLISDQTKTTGTNQMGTMYGQIVVEEQRQRLDAHPISKGKTSVFMGV